MVVKLFLGVPVQHVVLLLQRLLWPQVVGCAVEISLPCRRGESLLGSRSVDGSERLNLLDHCLPRVDLLVLVYNLSYLVNYREECGQFCLMSCYASKLSDQVSSLLLGQQCQLVHVFAVATLCKFLERFQHLFDLPKCTAGG